MPDLSLADIQAAQGRIAGVVYRTPLLFSQTFSVIADGQVYLKAENLQRTGSFKLRGALNKVLTLRAEEKVRGVIAASAGNHAQGVALAARSAGIAATIVMPETASLAKIEATKGYGAEVVLHGEDYEQAFHYAQRISQEQGLTLLHGFDDAAVIAGQGTLGLELAAELPDVDVVVVPVGGGGLISGVAAAMKERGLRCQIIGVQTEAAPAATRAYSSGRRVSARPSRTIADGIAIDRVGRLPLQLILRHVDEMVTVREETIAQSMALLMERSKLVVEGAGAVGLAALLEGKIPCQGKKVVLLLSGGNVDLNLVARVLEHGLATAGRYLALRVKLDDRPGQLARLLNCVSVVGANVLEIVHHRTGVPLLPVGQVEVELLLETRDAAHVELLHGKLEQSGYVPEAAPPGDHSYIRSYARRGN